MSFHHTPRLSLAAVLAASALCGCESDDAGSRNRVGVFVDGPVAGLHYYCMGGTRETSSGITTAAGEYACPEGQRVAFVLSALHLGSIPAVQPVTTPLDLVGPGATINNELVVAIADILMSVSSTDPVASNRISIPSSAYSQDQGMGYYYDSDILLSPTGSFAIYVINGADGNRYSGDEVKQHLAGNLNRLFAGTYAGQFSGDRAGTWRVTIGSDGVATGTLQNETAAETETLSGSMSLTLVSHGRYSFAGTSSGSTWNGFLDVGTGEFSGTWSGVDAQGAYTGWRK